MNILKICSFIIVWIMSSSADGIKKCIPRHFEGQATVVCVCNSTYCDTVGMVRNGTPGTFVTFTTSSDGLRFEKNESTMQPMSDYNDTNTPWSWTSLIFTELKINRSETFQEVYGFGGAFTDATGINLLNLSKKARRNLMRTYFGKNGIEFNLCRVPIGGTDFSTHTYAYNMWPENDMKLSNFSLSEEDFKFKIPFIKEAQKIATSELYLMSSVWSPPKWMKTNNKYIGEGVLFEKYYQTYADYHIRFLEEYKKANITFWAVSTGNEPVAGLTSAPLNSLGWLPRELGRWIVNHFGPTIRRSQFKDIIILGLDDMRAFMYHYLEDVFEHDMKALDYIDGFATHSYFDSLFVPSSVQDLVHERYPNQFFISTETAIGSMKKSLKIQKGSWKRAEVYALKLIDYFNHRMTGVINWNLATDEVTGGPSWNGQRLESLIMVDGDKDEFIKLPIFYAFGHFSKFVPRGSVRIKLDVVRGMLDCVAFLRPDKGVTVIFYNPWPFDRNISIVDESIGFMKTLAPKHSIQTVVYW